MDIKDVRSIYDIPHIEDYYDHITTLIWYSAKDGLQYYVTNISPTVFLHIYLMSDEDIFVTAECFGDLLAQKNIEYLEFSIGAFEDEPFEAYCYRPLVEERHKNYIISDK